MTDSNPARSGSDAKVLTEKRAVSKFGDPSDPSAKRVKVGQLTPAEGINTHSPDGEQSEETIGSVENKASQATEEALATNSSAAPGETTGKQTTIDDAPGPQDLNYVADAAHESTAVDPPTSKPEKSKMAAGTSVTASGGAGLDLNSEDASSLANQNPFYPYKNIDNLKPRDALECGSTTGPLYPEEKDPLRVWKEMKQNGFLSSSHGGVPVPKQRPRKTKNDITRKKTEHAKTEKTDRLPRLAAPSGLLNELNPGIINHVRNSKQVHSIIEALVKSEKIEKVRVERKQEGQHRRSKEIGERSKDAECENDSERNSCSQAQDEAGHSNPIPGAKQITGCLAPLKDPRSSCPEGKCGDLSTLEGGNNAKHTCVSHTNRRTEDDLLALKLSSSTNMAPEVTGLLSNEEHPNIPTSPPLCVKAATVASQWLELLHLDIKGRLAALRRSKKRVKSAIHTELPFLMSKEFSSTQEDNPVGECSYKSAVADLHHARWRALLDQMDATLSEEEKQLESWLNQVKDMQQHCGWGLQRVPCSAPSTLQELGILANDFRSEEEDGMERDLAVRAAAASIYSTCNFLSSAENVSCL